jgi:hypothetical protein
MVIRRNYTITVTKKLLPDQLQVLQQQIEQQIPTSLFSFSFLMSEITVHKLILTTIYC